MDIIHLLSESLANQIAAGEVVQRPASAVKELLENSIDAGATQIELILKDAGKTLLQVIDNGKGMSLTDARMSFERHATSKIKHTDDLFSIKTMGFRGEALASIAAVAQVELKTKTEGEELGTHISIEGSEFKFQESTSTKTGTNISVKNLFFNVPARRNFLKSNPVEMKHILQEFQHQVIAHPEISFKLYHNDQEIFNLPDSNLAKRIVDVHGKNVRNQLAECTENTDFVSISGFIGKPESAKKTRGEQYFYVNNRYIKSSYLNHAVLSAYQGTIAQGTYPFYVLFIEIDPKRIDINIHPTKTEIKFDDERAVYAILNAAVKKAMGIHNLGAPIDFNTNINFAQFKKPSYSEPLPTRKFDASRSISNFETENRFAQHEIPQQQEEIKLFNSKVNSLNLKEEKETVSVLQVHNQFIIAQVKSGLMLINQKLALERIFYEKFYKNLQQKKGASQQLLFPKTLSLSVLDYNLVQELMQQLNSLGFMLEEFGSNSIKITGIPIGLKEEDESQLLLNLIGEFKENQSSLSLGYEENLARSLAKRAANLSLKTLDKIEINELINQLFESEMPSTSPDGTTIMKIISLEGLHELILNSNS